MCVEEGGSRCAGSVGADRGAEVRAQGRGGLFGEDDVDVVVAEGVDEGFGSAGVGDDDVDV